MGCTPPPTSMLLILVECTRKLHQTHLPVVQIRSMLGHAWHQFHLGPTPTDAPHDNRASRHVESNSPRSDSNNIYPTTTDWRAMAGQTLRIH